jgi:transposase-like protein
MKQSRRHFAALQKAQIVRRHIIGKEAVSNLADEFGLQPSQTHSSVKQVLDQAERALERALERPAVGHPAQRGFTQSSSSSSNQSSSRRRRSSPS